jgi:ArsR family transcriptional regulator
MQWATVVRKCDLVSGVFASLAHPVRIKILCKLMDADQTVNDLAGFCDVAQPAMSQFLSRMKEEGLVEARRNGRFVHYRLADARLRSLMTATRKLYCD